MYPGNRQLGGCHTLVERRTVVVPWVAGPTGTGDCDETLDGTSIGNPKNDWLFSSDSWSLHGSSRSDVRFASD